MRAILLSELGHVKKALDYLDKAYEEKEEFLLFIKYQELYAFTDLRSDPRFIELMDRIWVKNTLLSHIAFHIMRFAYCENQR